MALVVALDEREFLHENPQSGLIQALRRLSINGGGTARNKPARNAGQ
jgi:hypothetical protein